MHFSLQNFFLRSALAAFLLLSFYPLTLEAAATSTSAVCPEYMAETGISVALSSELTSTVPSVPVGIHAVVQNDSGSPAYDGSLFVRVMDTSVTPAAIIGEFVPVKSLDVPAGATSSADFVWKVPAEAPAGDYRIQVFYVYPSSLFVPPPGAEPQDTAALTMQVASDAQSPVSIDQKGITVSGAAYNSQVAAYVFPDEPTITVTLPVVNDTQSPYKGEITWQLYERGRSPLSAPVKEETDAVKLHPQTTFDATYTISGVQAASYYLEADLSDGTSDSIAAIPLLRAGECASFPASTAPAPGSLMSVILEIVLAVFILLLAGWFLLWEKKRAGARA